MEDKMRQEQEVMEKCQSLESEIEYLEYLDFNLSSFIENLALSSDIIFDRYTIERHLKGNKNLIGDYESVLMYIDKLEKSLEEYQTIYKLNLTKLKKELSSLKKIDKE